MPHPRLIRLLSSQKTAEYHRYTVWGGVGAAESEI